ncbi:MAG: cupin domain-containing protein [Alphaproteobacteria bacterium]|nr:cupin domain-containing protein [Alphaproteobacteria bacterium]
MRIDVASLPDVASTGYPPALAARTQGRVRKALGDAAGLTQFGVRLTRLRPGAVSALRHWHAREDEFVYVLEGRPTLVTDEGEEALGPGDCAGFPAGVADGHHLVNKTSSDVLYLEIGTRSADETVTYPDDDLHYSRDASGARYTRKSGAPY